MVQYEMWFLVQLVYVPRYDVFPGDDTDRNWKREYRYKFSGACTIGSQ